ncbi:MAG: hypothetical protein D3924_10665 [Candidatus Electrothrix sp. AR4]|nr:hypothetical protein [Candidatus Electrothrix sp. AR4]
MTLLLLVSLTATNSAYAGLCAKGYGGTPSEAFKEGAKILASADAEMGKGWMKDNMQIRILPEKEKGLFVALVYSTRNKNSCDLLLSPKTAKADSVVAVRPKCETEICPI